MAGYSLRFSYRPRERLPVLSSTNVFQAHSEMLPRRCTEAQGFPELSESPVCCSTFSNTTRLDVLNIAKEKTCTSCQRNLCQRPKPSRHIDMKEPSDACPIKCCSMRRYRYHHCGPTQLWPYSTHPASKIGVIRC